MVHTSAQNDNKTKALARYIADLKFDDIPHKTLATLKASILDTLGCGLFGSKTEWGRILTEFACLQPGSAEIWGSPGIGSHHYVAMANATMAHGFELDDLHPGSRSHPGAVMTPLVLALRSQIGTISGRDMLVALAAGYEVQGRVGVAQGVSSFKRGWHPTGTAGSFGAAAAAARLHGLSVDQTQHALGIAGTMPAGLMAAQFGAMVKRLYVGHATWAGMMAAELAASGFTGVHDIFDAEFGGYFAAVSDEWSTEKLDQDLGTRFEAGNIGVKFWPCVGTNQSVLDAMAAITGADDFSADDVERIDVVTTAYQKLHSGWDYEPSSVMAAQMSMKYCLAALIIEGRLTIDEFTDAKIADPAILRLVGRIDIVADDTLDTKPGFERFAKVSVALRDGRVLDAERMVARGNPKNPATWADVAEKFRQLASRVLPQDRVEATIDLVSRLETLEDIEILNQTISTTTRME